MAVDMEKEKRIWDTLKRQIKRIDDWWNVENEREASVWDDYVLCSIKYDSHSVKDCRTVRTGP